MALYLKKLAVLDVANSTVAQLVNVMEGAEGSAVFGYNQTDSALVVANGQKTQFKQTHTVSLSVLPPSGADATVMDGILNAVEPLSVKVAGMSDDTFLLWDDAVALTQKDEYGDTLTRNLNMTLDATIGYRGTAPSKKKAVYSGGNLLALFDVLSGSSTALNGFTILNSATGSVTGATQIIVVGATTTENTVYLRSENLLFPFAGEVITASAYIVGADADFKIGIEFVQVNGTTIISTSYADIVLTSVRESVTATAPAGTAYVRLVIVADAVSTADRIDIDSPAIRLGTLSTYTN